jgi:acetyltransferase-like isoleucine patch superfamily enzyme
MHAAPPSSAAARREELCVKYVTQLQWLQQHNNIEMDVNLYSLVESMTLDLNCVVNTANGNTFLCSKTAIISKNVEVDISGENNLLIIGDSAQLNGTKISMRGSNCVIYFGSGVKFRSDRFSTAGDNAIIMVGKDTTMVGGGQVLSEASDQSIIIKDDCMLAHGVVLRTSDGHTIWSRESRELLNPPGSIVVEPHVWLANGVRVGKNSVIGTGCVIAQNSIVNSTLDPNSLYGGLPARKIRDGIVWSRNQSFEGIPKRFR